jgi:hypothetical protein
MPLTGGCQCGAVRFRVERLGRGSICHCRMCQKAFGAFFGPLVTGIGIVWTRGAPKHFRSSNRVLRGFCADCGTPLTYEYDGADGPATELAIGAFDDPAQAAPMIQLNPHDMVPFFPGLATLPMRGAGEEPNAETFKASVINYQHPDHDTAEWPPKNHQPKKSS